VTQDESTAVSLMPGGQGHSSGFDNSTGGSGRQQGGAAGSSDGGLSADSWRATGYDAGVSRRRDLEDIGCIGDLRVLTHVLLDEGLKIG